MSSDPNSPEDGPKPPPWINPEAQQKMAWRDGDIVISVPLKSGTTWTMNIVHQLREGGDPDLDYIYQQVPWIEFMEHPTTTVEDVVAKLDALPTDRRRAFKSHAGPPMLPYHPPGSGKEVKYIAVFRNPEEALVSARPFMAKHSQEWHDLWDVPRAALRRPDFTTFFNEVALDFGFDKMIVGALAAWWPLRRQSNVLMMHFADMKRDHEGSIRKIADFLGYEPTAEQWPQILECTSFDWMKAHSDKFDSGIAPTPVLESGAMMRKGQVGGAAADGMTPAVAAEIRATAQKMIAEPNALEWFYSGGSLPD